MTLKIIFYFPLFADPATISQSEQDMRAARVIRTNYSLLLEHLSPDRALPKLINTSVINESKKKEVESYQQCYGQNAVIIDVLFSDSIKNTAEGLLTICETLHMTPGKELIAQHLLRGTIHFLSRS